MWYVLLSDGTLQNTNDITDLRHVPELNLEGGKYGFYVNLRKALEELDTYEAKLNFIGDQITRYKMVIQRREKKNPFRYKYGIDILLERTLKDLHERLDDLNKSSEQLSLL